jgi:ABC-type glycerol-3-phosphate transport system permease component
MQKENAKVLKTKFSPFTIVLLIVLAAYVLSMFTLIGWALITSFKSPNDFRTNAIGMPEKFVWNYTFVYTKFYVSVLTESGMEVVYMETMFVYSILYSLGCAFFQTLVPCITAYLCARFNYKFSKIVYTAVIVVMILPIVGSLPAELQMAKNTGLYDSIWGLWIMKANFLGMYFLVFYDGFKGLSMTYTEAAKIDGASNMHILLAIVLPLVKNIFFTVMLVNFIGFWNDYQVPLLYMPSYPTVAYGMYNMANTRENNLSSVPMRMTGAMLMFIPIFTLFLIFQKRLLGNLTVGGIKG